MTDSCECQDLKDSLIRHSIVLGIADNKVRESLLRVPDSTLNETLEIARAAEATQSQLKQMQKMHEVNVEGRRKKSSSERNRKRRRNQQMVVFSRLTGSFGSGNIYQTCMYQVLCIWLLQCDKCGKATILLRSVQEENSSVVIYMSIRIWIMCRKSQMRVNLKSIL